jgi:hypothetical protein
LTSLRYQQWENGKAGQQVRFIWLLGLVLYSLVLTGSRFCCTRKVLRNQGKLDGIFTKYFISRHVPYALYLISPQRRFIFFGTPNIMGVIRMACRAAKHWISNILPLRLATGGLLIGLTFFGPNCVGTAMKRSPTC